jgi:DNA (cytosine-5)-methyltransferase 1
MVRQLERIGWTEMRNDRRFIPVIDVFAGPGGLGEGFNAFQVNGYRPLRICLSIESDPFAHQTLQLRSFFRHFAPGEVPQEYYCFLRGEFGDKELFDAYPREAEASRRATWLAELGRVKGREVDVRIRDALSGNDEWILIGGPPCQAYSLIGRSRVGGIQAGDHRVHLYRHYLRIIARHRPAIFVLENVPGLLNARIDGKLVFPTLLGDLERPARLGYRQAPRYKLYSAVTALPDLRHDDWPDYKPADFLVQCEKYGIPQRRRRLIVIGVREDLDSVPGPMKSHGNIVKVKDVLDGLPKLRSGLSKANDTAASWLSGLQNFLSNGYRDAVETCPEIREGIRSILSSISVPQAGRGARFVRHRISCRYRPDWFLDERIEGACNHEARPHMRSDLYRYLFVATFGAIHGRSPELRDFPEKLLPNHRNVREVGKERFFDDRFRVQIASEPAATVTSHLKKDGHYFIHPDPSQCRSITVREAARIQTFPDNYFFCGPRTSQFEQVGNAVPPLLALQIAKLVWAAISEARRPGQHRGHE